MYMNGQTPVIIFTELDHNPGMSVTNAVEWVCWEAYRQLLGGVGPEPIWIEHYPPREGTSPLAATFDQITFLPAIASIQKSSPRSLRPRWKRIRGEDVVKLTGDLP
jgi:hypothetical protein